MLMKVEELSLTRFPEIKDAKQIYTSNSKSQRNNNKRLMNKQLHPVRVEVTAQRILSARNHKIVDQSNEIHLLTKKIEDLKNENKTIKNQFIRHEKALTKIETKQTDLPRILDQHEAEVSNLKELLRRTKDTLNLEVKQRKEGDLEIRKLRDNLHRANMLIEDKGLEERNNLQLQINELQEKLSSKEKQLETSSKHIENLEKIHKKEVYTVKKQMKKYVFRTQELENDIEILRQNLKEKEKLLEIQNIYSQRFKGLNKVSVNDRLDESLSEAQNDHLLEKLDFSDAFPKTDDTYKDRDSDNHKISAVNSRVVDEERIKQDIRKILEEEILSGRIKPFEVIRKSPEVFVENSSHRSVDQSNDGRSTVQDSFNTEKAVPSEIFDKDPLTQVQATDTEFEIDEATIDQERRHPKLLLDKLNELDATRSNEEEGDISKLTYSYPHDVDYLGNEESNSDIETIPVTNGKPITKTYKFTNAIDNLHHGVPVQKNNADSVDIRQSRLSISKKAQLEASQNQRNNSNTETPKEELLPPLNSSEKKRRETELLSQLFGDDFIPQPVVHGRPYPTGTRQSRSGSQLWTNENESKKNDIQESLPDSRSNRSIDLNYSQDIEEIVL